MEKWESRERKLRKQGKHRHRVTGRGVFTMIQAEMKRNAQILSGTYKPRQARKKARRGSSFI